MAQSPRRLPPLNALKAFEAAARHGSLARAADELGVTPGAVSQQIRQLEALIGVALFQRHARGVALTDAAAAALPLLTDAFDRLREAGEALAGAGDQNIVRVGAPHAFGMKWLLPRLDGFAEAAPGFEAVMIADPSATELERSQIELEVRFGSGGGAGLEVRRLLTETVAPACAPRLLMGSGVERALSALQSAALLHDATPDQDPSCPDWPRWLRERGVERADAGRGDRFVSSEHVVEAAVAGRGLGLVKRTLAQAAIESGALEVLFVGDLTTLSWSYDLVWPKGRSLGPAARAFVQWLQNEAAPFESSGV